MTAASDGQIVKLGFVGDICLSLGVIDVVREHGPEFVFEKMRPLFDGFDLTVGNLECVIVDEDIATPPGRPPLHVPLDVARVVESSGIDVFGLANNHIMDRGHDGLRSTLEYLDGKKITHFGAGMSLETAEAPLFVDVGGRRIALLGACDVTAIEAGGDRPGVPPMRARALSRRIAEAKRAADVVVVVLHADLEFVPHPAPHRRRLSRRLIDHGADLVIQHHPHVCQGIERYNDGVIAYSLGNHVFHVAGNEYQGHRAGVDHGMALQVDIDFSGPRPKLDLTTHPLRIDDHHRPVPLDARDGLAQTEIIETLSGELGDNRIVKAAWWRICRKQVHDHIWATYYTLRRGEIILALKWQVSVVKKSENRRWILGFLSAGRI